MQDFLISQAGRKKIRNKTRVHVFLSGMMSCEQEGGMIVMKARHIRERRERLYTPNTL